jgi:antirestriction protein
MGYASPGDNNIKY